MRACRKTVVGGRMIARGLAYGRRAFGSGKPFAGLAIAPSVVFKCVGRGHQSHGGWKAMQAGAGRSKGRIVL